MVEKIRLIEARIAQLEEIIDKAKNGRSYIDIKWTQGLLDLNRKILVQLNQGLPIQFYKTPTVNEKPNFFLSTREVIEPFISVRN